MGGGRFESHSPYPNHKPPPLPYMDIRAGCLQPIRLDILNTVMLTNDFRFCRKHKKLARVAILHQSSQYFKLQGKIADGEKSECGYLCRRTKHCPSQQGNLKDTSSECLRCTEEWPYFKRGVSSKRNRTSSYQPIITGDPKCLKCSRRINAASCSTQSPPLTCTILLQT